MSEEKHKSIRISAELYEKLKEVAEKRGIAIKDVAEEAIRRYLGILEGVESDADIEKVVVVKNWVLRFPAICEVCGQRLEPGSRVVREIIVLADGRKVNRFYHPECYEHTSDPALARLYRKKRELERVIKALKKEADALADAINEAEARKHVLDASDEVRKVIHEIENELNSAIKLVRDYIFEVDPNNKDLRAVYEHMIKTREDVLNKLDEIARKLNELAAAMATQQQPRRRRRKAEIEEYRWW